jgi:hypothetical protein
LIAVAIWVASAATTLHAAPRACLAAAPPAARSAVVPTRGARHRWQTHAPRKLLEPGMTLRIAPGQRVRVETRTRKQSHTPSPLDQALAQAERLQDRPAEERLHRVMDLAHGLLMAAPQRSEAAYLARVVGNVRRGGSWSLAGAWESGLVSCTEAAVSLQWLLQAAGIRNGRLRVGYAFPQAGGEVTRHVWVELPQPGRDVLVLDLSRQAGPQIIKTRAARSWLHSSAQSRALRTYYPVGDFRLVIDGRLTRRMVRRLAREE